MKINALLVVATILFAKSLFGQLSLDEKIERFEQSLAYYKEQLELPGLSVVILKDQKIVWESAMGYADVENQLKASPATVYQLASVTKPIASTALLRLVEDGKIDLNEPLRNFAPDLDPSGKIKLHHLLTHTSEGEPGTTYNYNGNLYSRLDLAIKERSAPLRVFCDSVFFSRLQMESTVANPLDPELLERFGEYLKEKGEEPVIRRKGKKKYSIDKFELSDSKRENYGRAYWLSVGLLSEAMAASGIDTSMFETNYEHDLDQRTIDQFITFYQETEVASIEKLKRLAKPYVRKGTKGTQRGRYNLYFGGGAGFNSTVQDLARFDQALDQNLLITRPSKQDAFTINSLKNGKNTPYGYGWFTQTYNGTDMIWHGGEWDCASALYYKLPEEGLTLIVLTNSRNLSGAFAMGEGDVLNSGVALDFYKHFVLDDGSAPNISWNAPVEQIIEDILQVKPQVMRDLYLKQVHVIGLMSQQMGDPQKYMDLLSALREKGMLPSPMDQELTSLKALVELSEIKDNQELAVKFSLESTETLRIYGTGEGISSEMYDYGWITDASGEIVWQMTYDKTTDAGGAAKNRLVNTTIELPAGEYRLHYKGDDSHSYLQWNTRPPDNWYWGIRVWKKE